MAEILKQQSDCRTQLFNIDPLVPCQMKVILVLKNKHYVKSNSQGGNLSLELFSGDDEVAESTTFLLLKMQQNSWDSPDKQGGPSNIHAAAGI